MHSPLTGRGISWIRSTVPPAWKAFEGNVGKDGGNPFRLHVQTTADRKGSHLPSCFKLRVFFALKVRTFETFISCTVFSFSLVQIHFLFLPFHTIRNPHSACLDLVDCVNLSFFLRSTRPDLPWGPPSPLYIGYRVSFRRETGRSMVITTQPT